MMDRLLRALSFSEQGLAQMTISDKACCLMEWNDDRRTAFQEVKDALLSADI
jgi:alkylhydroperoxidase family enzyme